MTLQPDCTAREISTCYDYHHGRPDMDSNSSANCHWGCVALWAPIDHIPSAHYLSLTDMRVHHVGLLLVMPE